VSGSSKIGPFVQIRAKRDEVHVAARSIARTHSRHFKPRGGDLKVFERDRGPLGIFRPGDGP
jgi:hypothetical protein